MAASPWCVSHHFLQIFTVHVDGHRAAAVSAGAMLHPLTMGVRVRQVAFVGFAVQALVTREQPIEGLNAHLADPFGHNIITCGSYFCSNAVVCVHDLHTDLVEVAQPM